MKTTRREFTKNLCTIGAGLFLPTEGVLNGFDWPAKKPFFTISLAEWSLHKTIFGGKMTNLDFPVVAKRDFGISVVEYVNQFFKDKAKDTKYLSELLMRCKDNGVKNHLIMIDAEGPLASTDAKERAEAVENHKKWVEAAKFLGCQTIRVNLFGKGARAEVSKAGTEGLRALCEFAKTFKINVIVENHGGYTSDGAWLAETIKNVGMKNCGILGDFGNFCVKRDNGEYWGGKCVEEYDRYKGIAEFMPYSKAISAKTFDFDADGNCVETDYVRMLKIIKNAGFKGYMGIEYEGDNLSEEEGIRKTKALLEKVGAMI